MSYSALARKWRPKHFKDIVGQEHVVQALSNAFKFKEKCIMLIFFQEREG